MEANIKELQIELEAYAKEHNVPIMEIEGLEFLRKQIKENNTKSILEVGSAIGYSAMMMASLDPEITITTIELDENRYLKAVDTIKRAKLEERVTLIHGNALETVIEGKYDLIFIDAAKAQYTKFFERYESNLANGGIIVSDNLSFHGFVEDNTKKMSRNLRQLVGKIKRYIDWLKNNENYDTEFHTIGDGIAISKKKNN